ncbi:MAG: hypothetical protein AAFU85_20925 [Planctomycetota bacterium]
MLTASPEAKFVLAGTESSFSLVKLKRPLGKSLDEILGVQPQPRLLLFDGKAIIVDPSPALSRPSRGTSRRVVVPFSRDRLQTKSDRGRSIGRKYRWRLGAVGHGDKKLGSVTRQSIAIALTVVFDRQFRDQSLHT